MDIPGIAAVVTGASGGIGQATAAMLLDAGAARVGLLGRDGDRLRAAHDALAGRFGTDRVSAIPADVRDPDAVRAGLAAFAAAGGFRLLVNNAGVLNDGAVFGLSFKGPVRYTAAAWDETLGVNLTGAFHVTQAALEFLVATKNVPAGQSKGVVVNVSSISRLGRAGQAAYSASKAGIAAFTVSLAQELAPLRVRSVAVAPGVVDTPMAARIPEAYRTEMIARTAARRMGRPDEIAHGVRFCVENEFFNGRVLELDGGAF
jgi:3-oxoacyl-[acyl-carrier protein] reductase